MGIKKIIISLLLLISMSLVLFGQQSNDIVETNNSVQKIDESQIVFNDTSNNENQTTTENKKQNSTVWIFVRMIIALVIVVACIYGVLWFIKKRTNVIKDEDDFLRKVAFINLSPGKSVEIVTLIDKGYILGVTDNNISLLGEIDDKELVEALNLNSDKKHSSKKPMNFSDVLDIFTGKSKNIFSDSEKNIENRLNQNKDNINSR
ncbi:MAG: FliO/MopB family protein [Treponema sp.]|jgi:flagellar protein FliO/FliZ|nr:FliO/MopB family protein [Treponema sp.]